MSAPLSKQSAVPCPGNIFRPLQAGLQEIKLAYYVQNLNPPDYETCVIFNVVRDLNM